MPITKELENIQCLESAGFSHQQAETLTKIIEQSHVDGQQNLKEFFDNRIDKLELRLKASQTEMELRLKTAQTDLLLKFSGIVAAFISAALAIAKLLW